MLSKSYKYINKGHKNYGTTYEIIGVGKVCCELKKIIDGYQNQQINSYSKALTKWNLKIVASRSNPQRLIKFYLIAKNNNKSKDEGLIVTKVNRTIKQSN